MMTSIDFVSAGIISAAREAMKREEEVVQDGTLHSKCLDDVVRYRDVGLVLWRSLLVKVEETLKDQVEKFINEQEEAVERLAGYLPLQDQINRNSQKYTEKRNERFARPSSERPNATRGGGSHNRMCRTRNVSSILDFINKQDSSLPVSNIVGRNRTRRGVKDLI